MKKNNNTGFTILAIMVAVSLLLSSVQSHIIHRINQNNFLELHQQNEELRTELAELAEKERTIVQNVRVVTDGVADDQIYAFTAEGWLQYLMELPGNRCVSRIDMNMFDYALTEAVQWPEEVADYIENTENPDFGICSNPNPEYHGVFFGRGGLPLELSYLQNPDWQASRYVDIQLICDRNAEHIINCTIDGAENSKKVYCTEYCEGIGRELLVFTIDGKLYAVNEAMEIYEVYCRTDLQESEKVTGRIE